MNKMVNIISHDPEMLMVGACDRLGGVDIFVGVNPRLKETIEWVQTHRASIEQERRLRETDPELKHLFDQYQTYLNLKYSLS